MTAFSLEEHRSWKEELDRELDLPNPDPAETLFALRALLAHLEGHQHVEPDVEERVCDDCKRYVLCAWTHGTVVVCRTCRRKRVNAQRDLDSGRHILDSERPM